jgi:hypothetical protein
MRRNTLLLLVGAVAALAVACRDSVVAPAPTPNLSSLSKSGPTQERTVIGTVELSRSGGTYHIGDFDVVIPAGAICDPAKTNYGPRHWNEGCSPLTRSMTVKVVATTRNDRVSIDFQPDIRFSPSAGPVTIQTLAYRDLLTSDAVRQLPRNSAFFGNFRILYVPTGGQSRIDEARSNGDASLVTHVDLSTGLVWRQVKHFSGYMITSGNKCESVDVETTCIPDDGLGGVGVVTGQVVGVTLAGPLPTDVSVVVTP